MPRAPAWRRPIELWLCAALAGCQPSGLASLPPMPGRASVLIARVASNLMPGADELYAIDLSAPLPVLNFPDEAEIWALGYDAGLSDLGLMPGPVQKPPAGASDSLPVPQEALRFDETWRAVAFDDGLRGRLRLPARGTLVCLASGGCPTQEPGNPCLASCAPTDPTLPTAPDGVRPPEPVPARVHCSDTSVQPRLSSNCQPIAPCPSGRWPDTLPANAWYVDGDAAPGGDGSLATPYARLSQAVAAAAEADVIAFRGSSSEDVYSSKSLTILGTCPEQSRWLAGTAAGDRGTLHLENGARLQVEGVSIEGIMYASNASISLSRVSLDVRASNDPALWVDGGALSLDAVRVRTRSAGTALRVANAGLDAHALVLEGGAGLIDCEDARCAVRDSVLLGSSVPLTGSSVTSTRSLLTLDGVLFEDQRQALFASLSTVSANQLVIRRSGPAGGAIELQRSLFSGSFLDVSDLIGNGLLSCDGELHIQDLAIRGVAVDPENTMGLGVGVHGARVLDIARLFVSGTRGGMGISDPGDDRRGVRCGQALSEVTLSDLTFIDGREGHAVELDTDGPCSVTRVQVEGWGQRGLTLGKRANLALLDVSIKDVGGPGITLKSSLDNRIERVLIANVGGVGIDVDLTQFVTKGETSMEQLTVFDTHSAPDARSLAGPALRLERGQFKIKDFLLHHNQTGMELGSLNDSELINGQVHDHDTGIVLLERDVLLPTFDRVQLSDNQVPISTPGP